MSHWLDLIRQQVKGPRILPEDNVYYCAVCASTHLSASVRVVFRTPEIPEIENSDAMRELSLSIGPGYDAVVKIDYVLRSLQARDPSAYVEVNAREIVSVRVCSFVNGTACCIIHAGDLFQYSRGKGY